MVKCGTYVVQSQQTVSGHNYYCMHYMPGGALQNHVANQCSNGGTFYTVYLKCDNPNCGSTTQYDYCSCYGSAHNLDHDIPSSSSGGEVEVGCSKHNIYPLHYYCEEHNYVGFSEYHDI